MQGVRGIINILFTFARPPGIFEEQFTGGGIHGRFKAQSEDFTSQPI